jgi:hypothetical protein
MLETCVSRLLIDEIVREGARRVLAEALQAEVEAHIAAHAAERDENGRPSRHAGPGPGRRRWGAGFLEWAAEGVPQTREGRCWFHKTANVLARRQRAPPRRLVRAVATFINGKLPERPAKHQTRSRLNDLHTHG